MEFNSKQSATLSDIKSISIKINQFDKIVTLVPEASVPLQFGHLGFEYIFWQWMDSGYFESIDTY